jgi:hypothetical protein
MRFGERVMDATVAWRQKTGGRYDPSVLYVGNEARVQMQEEAERQYLYVDAHGRAFYQGLLVVVVDQPKWLEVG